MQHARLIDARPRVASATDAGALADAVLESLAALSHLVGEETQLLRAGRLAEAMAREPRKSELAGLYMRGVEQVRLNAVALARFAPDRIKRLRAAHQSFQTLLETNQAVLATARAVSEAIVRDLAGQAARPSRAAGYGPAASVGAGMFARPAASPLVVSRKL